MSVSKFSAKAQILVRRPIEEVFNAIVDPTVMSKFWFWRTDVGLSEGTTSTWFVGDATGAIEIEVRVKLLEHPNRLEMEWGHGTQFTNVVWTFFEHEPNVTRLVVEERGFAGSRDEIFAQALDSTAGFNQVVVALKALLEHGSIVNVVADHV